MPLGLARPGPGGGFMGCPASSGALTVPHQARTGPDWLLLNVRQPTPDNTRVKVSRAPLNVEGGGRKAS